VSLRGQEEAENFVEPLRGITANVGLSGVDRIDFSWEEIGVYGGDCKVILTKNHRESPSLN
jgi:hypothetical protein